MAGLARRENRLAAAYKADSTTRNRPIVATSAGDRYLNPFSGSDDNDGRTPQTAWKSVAQLNSALLKANITGITRILIDAPPEHPLPLPVTLDAGPPAVGITISSARPGEFAWLLEYKNLDPKSFSQPDPTICPHVWQTSDAQNASTIFEKGESGRPDDLKLYYFANAGSTLSATLDTKMKQWLESKAGSYWNDGNRIYFHPSDNGNPTRQGAPKFARSYRYGDNGNGMFDQDRSNGVDIRTTATIEDLAIVGGMIALAGNGDPYGAYNMRVTPGPGITRVRNCYLAYGSKHGLGAVIDTTFQSTLMVENVEVEFGSPYGGSTSFVSFAGNGATVSTHTYKGCKVLHPLAKMWDQSNYPRGEAFLMHGAGKGPEPFHEVTISNCDFGTNQIDNYGGSIAPLHVIETKFGSGSGYGDYLVERSRLTFGLVTGAYTPPGNTSNISARMIDCIIAPEANLLGGGSSTITGSVTLDHCLIDLKNQRDRFIYLAAGITTNPQTGKPGNQIHMHNTSVIFPPGGCALAGYLYGDTSPVLIDCDRNHFQLGQPQADPVFRKGDGVFLTFAQWRAQSGAGNIYDPSSIVGPLKPEELYPNMAIPR